MADAPYDRALVIAAGAELAPIHRVWGTGGWLPPEGREALDWFTLLRLLGWGTRVLDGDQPVPDALPLNAELIVIAYDPDAVSETRGGQLRQLLNETPALVIARAATSGTPLAEIAGASRRPERHSGRVVHWRGPGPERTWTLRSSIEAVALQHGDTATTWVTLEGAPIVAMRPVGRGVVLSLGFHPSHARDAGGTVTAVLEHMLCWGSPTPVAWLDWRGTMVLRMDDPGGAQNVHSRSWAHRKLDEAAWAAIGADLRRRDARLSIAYVAGWVDDGEAARGDLRVAGRPVDRVAGAVYPSPQVQYLERHGHLPGVLHDYGGEYRGIQALRAAGLGDIELHGYTHMFPDGARWAAAADRYDAVSWFRELGRSAEPVLATLPPDQHPLAQGVAALAQLFGVRPTTLVSPGDEWTDAALARALDLGLQLISSYYHAIRDDGRFCWTQHVCAPYLDEPSAAWFDTPLPVVGYFHDRDVAVQGVDWMTHQLDQWQACGATRFVDFRECAGAVGRRLRMQQTPAGLQLHVDASAAPALVRPVPVNIIVPAAARPARVRVLLDGTVFDGDVDWRSSGHGRLLLPIGAPAAS